ncbi:hypothetical protein [Glaciecola sp. SC05]|uniref:hypothetical protein n=1 Tax=Glaciecola sp. SC05 TaxID=1987355 RepID=UPI0035272CBE
MEFSGIILTLLFLIVIGLFAFCLTEPRGKNTVYARKENETPTPIDEHKSANTGDSISRSYSSAYNMKSRNTEAA